LEVARVVGRVVLEHEPPAGRGRRRVAHAAEGAVDAVVAVAESYVEGSVALAQREVLRLEELRPEVVLRADRDGGPRTVFGAQQQLRVERLVAVVAEPGRLGESRHAVDAGVASGNLQ